MLRLSSTTIISNRREKQQPRKGTHNEHVDEICNAGASSPRWPTILPGWAGEHRDKEKADTIALDAVPACVSKAAAQYLATADTKEAKKIVEEGIVKYEVMGGKDKEDVEVTLTANGEVLKVTRNMDTEKLPVAMVAAIQKDYPGVKLRKVESVQRFYYEVDAVVDSKHREFKAMASGDIEGQARPLTKGPWTSTATKPRWSRTTMKEKAKTMARKRKTTKTEHKTSLIR